MSDDSLEEDNSAQLRQRLWGAAVLIAIAVIVLPLMLDGAGSESQFRRVEQLRQEPETLSTTSESVQTERVVAQMSSVTNDPLNQAQDSSAKERVERVIGNALDDNADAAHNDAVRAEREMRETLLKPTQATLTAWVVQAAKYTDETSAIELRDRLRRAGFASFVRDRDAGTDPYRVLVGPMIKQATAEKALERVAALLQNSPVLMSYP